VRSLAVDDQTARVMAALDARRIDALLLKGPAVARRLYPEDEPRFYGDTDVLVAPRAVPAAEATLRALGYERIVGDRTIALFGHHGSHWRRRSSALVVDLHRTLTGVLGDAGTLWDALWAASTGLEVQATAVRVLDASGLALHVALHAAQHGVARDTSLRDLELALRHLVLADWRGAAALAERVDAVDAFGVGLRLVPDGEAVAARLGLPPNRSRNAALRAMAAPSVTLGLDRLSATLGVGAKARLVVGRTFPPRDFMRIRSGCARRGPAGMALAYLWRLLSLAGQAVPAARAWRRAARASRSEGSA